MTISPNRPSTKQGRPLVTDGRYRCSRCQRMANQRRAAWPGEDLCSSCFYTAMRNRGVCPGCGHDGVLPGLALDGDRRPICRSCAGIPGDFTCQRCGTEGDLYRRGTCVRCALRDDLTVMMINSAHDPDAIVDALCRNGSCPPSAASPHTSSRDASAQRDRMANRDGRPLRGLASGHRARRCRLKCERPNGVPSRLLQTQLRHYTFQST